MKLVGRFNGSDVYEHNGKFVDEDGLPMLFNTCTNVVCGKLLPGDRFLLSCDRQIRELTKDDLRRFYGWCERPDYLASEGGRSIMKDSREANNDQAPAPDQSVVNGLKAKTVCVNCRYHNGALPEDSTWDHRCLHPSVSRHKEQDPVTGLMGYAHKNDLGGVSILNGEENAHPYCRSLNNGNCSMFEPN